MSVNGYVYVGLSVVILGLGSSTFYYKHKYEKALEAKIQAEMQAAQFELSINKQNEKIEKLNKQITNYRGKIKTQRQEITKRFKKLNADNIKTCEDSLKYLNDLLKVYKEK